MGVGRFIFPIHRPHSSIRVLSWLVLAASVCSTAPFSAMAHNYAVHEDMTDVAYEIMLMIDAEESTPGVFGNPAVSHTRTMGAIPEGVNSVEWIRFLGDITKSVNKLRSLNGNFDTFPSKTCFSTLEVVDPNWAKNKKLGELAHPIVPGFSRKNDCGIRYDWSYPGGIFEPINGLSRRGRVDHTGIALGAWAASIDDEIDDTHLWFRPTSVLGFGAVKSKVSELAQTGIEILALPFVCAFDCIFNSCDDCAGHAKDLAADADPISNLEGVIPGVGDIAGPDYVGMWHHINMTSHGNADFDDHPGLNTERAGPQGMPDAVEIALMAGADLAGMSLRYDKSNGPKRYQIATGHDGHRDTRMRGESKWQFTTWPHLVFEPLDNLAHYGWARFRNEPTMAHHLAWPLHALGDATVPMHVTATSGWGHRPFEDATEIRWKELVYNTSSANAHERADQFQQARNILRAAFAWRQQVLAWRQAVPGRGNDVPVRELVTGLAQYTLNYVNANRNPISQWPFIPWASTTYLLNKTWANDIYSNADGVSRSRPLVEQGIAASLAFLVSAAESIP